MKKALLSSLFVLAAALPSQAGITLNLGAGQLSQFDGSPLPDNSLIQLIVSTTDSVFSLPDTTKFVAGDDLLLASFGLNSSTTGTPGVFTAEIRFDLINGVTTGDQLLLRWFELPSDSVTASAGTRYGQIRLDAAVDGSIPWTVPADGGTYDLIFLTVNAGGSSPDALGFASSVVIPEPSTYAAILGGLTLGVVALRRRAKK